MTFRLVDATTQPLIGPQTPGAQDVRHGFEGGRVLRLDGVYHLLISEMVDDPKFVKTRLGHWRSVDGDHWERVATLYESTGDFTGHDPRAAIFLPQPIYNEAEARWNLFYAAFHAAPNANARWLLNHHGRIWRARSTVPGPGGLGGPYEDVGIVLEPGPDSDVWEGLQGTDSFFPYAVGERWYAFYGSAHTQKWPCDFWGVGLATAPALAGPWQRCSQWNPVLIDRPFIENPIVTRLPDGSYAAVYDAVLKGRAIGVTVSPDGLTWPAGQRIPMDAAGLGWLTQTRTPLSLIPREAPNESLFDVFFTGEMHGGYRCLGRITLALEA